MSLSYPLSLAQFGDLLRVNRQALHCPSPMSNAQTAGGEVLRARLGASLWRGEAALSFERQVNTRGIRGLLDALLDEHASFIFSPHDYYGPAADLGGQGLGGASPTIDNVAADGRVRFAGLPVGYRLSPDDLVSWTYASGPVRYAFHRLLEGGVANGAGQVSVAVWPHVRIGWAQGAAANFISPRMKAVMLDRDPGASAGMFYSGASFEFVQTLR